MLLLGIFIVLIVCLLIFVGYRNEKRYQDTRQKQRKYQAPVIKTPHTFEQAKINIETQKMPQGNYPPFTHDRLLEMGLSDEEAKEFIHELIPQIEIQIPLIQEAVQALDFHKMERLTHSIKGSATNLGTGGISDLLVAFNTYLKTGTDIDIAKAYFNHLLRYNSELKAQYS